MKLNKNKVLYEGSTCLTTGSQADIRNPLRYLLITK